MKVSATLATLLDAPDLQIRLIVPPADVAALDAAVTWVHSSDLPDPTPWLEPGQVLLTTGAQFLTPDCAADDYVSRLVAAGVLALGFSTGVLHSRIPEPVREACAGQGLVLLEVADRTPFISIVRFVADRIAAEREERLQWALGAHRSLARAALRPDGLEAVLAELERQLDCWVALYDAAANPVPARTSRPVPVEAQPVVADAVRTVLAGGIRAAIRVASAGTEITVQTMGQRNRLRGALAVGTTARLDTVGTDLVTSVIALASIALDQTRSLDSARRRLRTGLLELLLSGEASVAQRTAEQLWGPLPAEPLQVALLAAPPTEMIMASLEQYVTNHASDVFFAERAGRLVVIATEDRLPPVLRLLGAATEHTVGVSSPVGWQELEQGVEEARRAARLGSGSPRLIRFADLAGSGLLGYLEVGGGAAVARRVLAPLLDRPDPERETLLATIKAWTDHNCAWEPAAQELHVHRHTLRNRIDQIGTLLDLDLSSFAGRAELWTAVQLLDPA